jgi:hypothetical protein
MAKFTDLPAEIIFMIISLLEKEFLRDNTTSTLHTLISFIFLGYKEYISPLALTKITSYDLYSVAYEDDSVENLINDAEYYGFDIHNAIVKCFNVKDMNGIKCLLPHLSSTNNIKYYLVVSMDMDIVKSVIEMRHFSIDDAMYFMAFVSCRKGVDSDFLFLRELGLFAGWPEWELYDILSTINKYSYSGLFSAKLEDFKKRFLSIN